jgi:hypothetical protein
MFARVKYLFIANPGHAESVASAFDVLENELKWMAPVRPPAEPEPARENPPPDARIMAPQGQGLEFRSFVFAL